MAKLMVTFDRVKRAVLTELEPLTASEAIELARDLERLARRVEDAARTARWNADGFDPMFPVEDVKGGL